MYVLFNDVRQGMSSYALCAAIASAAPQVKAIQATKDARKATRFLQMQAMSVLRLHSEHLELKIKRILYSHSLAADSQGGCHSALHSTGGYFGQSSRSRDCRRIGRSGGGGDGRSNDHLCVDDRKDGEEVDEKGFDEDHCGQDVESCSTLEDKEIRPIVQHFIGQRRLLDPQSVRDE